MGSAGIFHVLAMHNSYHSEIIPLCPSHGCGFHLYKPSLHARFCICNCVRRTAPWRLAKILLGHLIFLRAYQPACQATLALCTGLSRAGCRPCVLCLRQLSLQRLPETILRIGSRCRFRTTSEQRTRSIWNRPRKSEANDG